MTPTPQRTSTPTWWLVVGALAGIATATAAWLVVRAADDNETATPSAVGTGPGVAHVHGLGIDPADDALVIATHYGSFRLPAEGTGLERIGDSFQDTMGFTIAGPRDYLGSGHPDVQGLQAGQPSSLGLIESTDGGETWTNLSLSGEVDFHALAFAHDQVYGWDSSSGEFMVSTDRQTWETRSTLDLFGFAVDPDDPDHLIATGPSGLIQSSDGGRTWNGADGPDLVVVAWDPEAGLWGADQSGTVWHQTEQDWSRVSTLSGPPQAFLATPDALYAAAQDGEVAGIYTSTDDGASWDLIYRDS